jgi:hypothetical protein
MNRHIHRVWRWLEDLLGIHEEHLVRWVERGKVHEKPFRYEDDAWSWAAEHLAPRRLEFIICQPAGKAIDLNIKVAPNKRELR